MLPRLLVVTRTQAGRTVLDLLRGHFRLAPTDVKHLLKQRGIRLSGEICRERDLIRRVRPGQRLRIEDPRSKIPERKRGRSSIAQAESQIPIVYSDDHVVVANKPAGLTTVRHAAERASYGTRGQKFLPATLVDLLTSQIRRAREGKGQGRLRAVHRLDKETSGLIVLARTPEAERALGLQFRSHSIERTYLALVRGQAEAATIESIIVPDRGDGRRGSLQTQAKNRQGDSSGEKGQHAVTHVRVIEHLGEFALVECRLETGRTHQVRIHLGENGTPLCGERVYDRPMHGRVSPDQSGADRPMLHAASLGFEHPTTKERLHFETAAPEDMRNLLQRLRKPATLEN